MEISDVSGVTALLSEDFDFFVRGVFLGVVGSSAAFRLLELIADDDAAVVFPFPPTVGTDRLADRVTTMINLSVDFWEDAAITKLQEILSA